MARILIVDDSILMRRNLRTLLTEAGHEVVAEASNGMEGYKEYDKHRPDLVTMDITMPVMSGIDSLKRILATYPDANVIMISALDQRNMVFEAIQSGARHYILKPITMEKILKTIHDVLKEAGLLRADAVPEGAEAAAAAGAGKGKNAAFSIENKNGVFIISLLPHIQEEGLQSVRTAVQGFLFMKPLRVIFHFDGVEAMTDARLGVIKTCMRNIQAADGSVRVVTTDIGFMKRLREDDEELFSRIYTDMDQIIL
ncbi:response regulator [Gorillibacterium sp. sgz5001074]|uniref:response regulator n=1 Tax=Gorillibacterium sp. sgz5001074 TaxID=3446695 RepID=UPI003F6800C7